VSNEKEGGIHYHVANRQNSKDTIIINYNSGQVETTLTAISPSLSLSLSQIASHTMHDVQYATYLSAPKREEIRISQ
jgi:hypothetical protein